MTPMSLSQNVNNSPVKEEGGVGVGDTGICGRGLGSDHDSHVSVTEC